MTEPHKQYLIVKIWNLKNTIKLRFVLLQKIYMKFKYKG